MANLFLTPRKIITGSDALNVAVDEMALLGSKALIVTDSMMIQLGNVERLQMVLASKGISYSVYGEVNSEPTDLIVEAGVKKFKEEGCDFLIAIGGGSPIDTMKAIAMMSVYEGSIASYMGQMITDKLANMAAIPTTAGTGSEATQFTIITDTKTDVKMLLKGEGLLPDLAIIDPQFTMTAPAGITAATGVDALTHAVEAFTSKKAQPISDTFALSAVQRIFKSLKTAYDEPQNIDARNQMAIASLEAGIAFNNSSVTLVHGMSRPIGALFHVAHGLSNAMLLNVCLKFAAQGCADRFAILARACGMADDNVSDDKAKDIFLDEIEALLNHLNIPTLEGFGIDKEAFFEVIDKMADDAFASGSPSNTRRDTTVDVMKELYAVLW